MKLWRRLIPLAGVLLLLLAAGWYFITAEKPSIRHFALLQVMPENTTGIWVIEEPSRITNLLDGYQTASGPADLLKAVYGDSAQTDIVHPCAIFRTSNQFVLCIPSAEDKSTHERMATTLGALSLKVTVSEDGNYFFLAKNDVDYRLANQLSPSDSILIAGIQQCGKTDIKESIFVANSEKLHLLAGIGSARSADIHLTSNGIRAEVVYPDMSPNHPTLNEVPKEWVEILPSQTLSFQALGFESGADFFTQAQLENRSAFNGTLAELETHYQRSVDDMLYTWWSGGIGLLTMAPKQEYLLLGCADALLAATALSNLPEATTTPSGQGLMVQWSADSLLSHLFAPFSNIRYTAAVVLDNVVIFAENTTHLNLLLSSQGIDSEHPLYLAMHRGDAHIAYHKSHMSLIDYPASLWVENDLVLVHGSIQNELFFASYTAGNISTNKASDTSENWKFALSEAALAGPFAIPDHKAGGYYLLVQDASHTLIAVDKAGQSMWKVPLKSAITGQPEAIDLYRNGKYQIAFANKEGIHCIDLNGNYVKGFPFAGNSSTTSRLLVADYDNNRQYRFIAGQEGGQLVNVRNEGEKTPGWIASNQKSAIHHLDHIRSGNKDYLFVSDADGKIALLARDGSIRFETKSSMQSPASNLNFRMTGDIASSSVIALDTAGHVVESVFGKSGSLINESISPGVIALKIADLDNDRLQEFITVRNGQLEVYRADGSLFFNTPLPEGNQEASIELFNIGSIVWIAVCLANSDETYFVDVHGTIKSGFPIKGGRGCTLRDLDKNGIPDLVVLSSSGVMTCYPFN